LSATAADVQSGHDTNRRDSESCKNNRSGCNKELREHAEETEDIARKEVAAALANLQDGWKQVWGRDLEARKRSISNALNNAGITDATELISAPLSASFIAELAAADRSNIESLIQATQSP